MQVAGGQAAGHLHRSSCGYFTKYQFSGLMFERQVLRVTPRRLPAISVSGAAGFGSHTHHDLLCALQVREQTVTWTIQNGGSVGVLLELLHHSAHQLPDAEGARRPA
jgi:hypothetical protein